MAKTITIKKFNTASQLAKIKQQLKNKYFNVFMNKFEFNGIDDYWTEDFIMKRMYYKGQVMIFNLKGYGPIASDYTVLAWGLNHRPAIVSPVMEDPVPNLPSNLVVDQEAVLGYLQSTRTSLYDTIMTHINRMADYYGAMFVNLQVNKIPFLIQSENIDMINVLLDRIYSNELAVFCPNEISDMIQVFNTGAEFLLDKYWTQILNEENELLTELGIDCNALNMNRITADQSNANNSLINNINDGFNKQLSSMCDKVNELFGVNWSIQVKQPEVESVHQNELIHEEEVEE